MSSDNEENEFPIIPRVILFILDDMTEPMDFVDQLSDEYESNVFTLMPQDIRQEIGENNWKLVEQITDENLKIEIFLLLLTFLENGLILWSGLGQANLFEINNHIIKCGDDPLLFRHSNFSHTVGVYANIGKPQLYKALKQRLGSEFNMIHGQIIGLEEASGDGVIIFEDSLF